VLWDARDNSAYPGRAPPDPIGRRELGCPGEIHRRRQGAEARRPMISPHAQVDVDDVVVGDREPAEAVGDREGPPLVGGRVVPDDPEPIIDSCDAEAAREAEAAEPGIGAGPVAVRSLADRDVVDRLAAAERDVPIGAAERAGEVEGELLANEERPVRLNLNGNVGGRQRIRLGRRGRRPQERGGDEREKACSESVQFENCTDGASRVAPSVSK
jgi:hypothetical protein